MLRVISVAWRVRGEALESGGAENLEKRGWGKRMEGKSNAPHFVAYVWGNRPQYYCLRLTRGCKEGQRAKIEVVRPPRGVNSPRTTHHSGRTAATMSWRILFTAFS